MTGLRFSFVFLFVFGFLWLANGNPISNLFGKSGDDKAEADDKTTVGTSLAVKSAGETTTTTTATPEPGSSCGGLKGFLHICDRNAETEPPKSVKTRSASEEDDSDEDEDEDDDDDDDDDSESKEGDEKSIAEKEKQEPAETSPVISGSTEGGIAKRQVGDPEAPVLGDIPPVVEDAMQLPEKTEDGGVENREVDEGESRRRRRDCRDREGDYEKDCRKKREFVPSCFGSDCRQNETTNATE